MMKFSNTVLLLIGFLCAVVAELYFDYEEASQLSIRLRLVEEADGLALDSPNDTSLGYLTCIDDDDPFNPPRFTKVEDGASFITIKPYYEPYTEVFARPFDFEVISVDLNQVNEKKISIRCEKALDPTQFIVFEELLALQDVNDNVPFFVRTNETYSTQVDEFFDPRLTPLLIYGYTSRNPIVVRDEDGTPNNNWVEAECVSMRTRSSDVKRPCDGFFSVKAVNLAYGLYYFEIYALRAVYVGETSYRLEIRAVNEPFTSGRVLLSTTQNVNIYVRDLQNQPPYIDKDTLSFEMFENLPPGSRLVGFIAAYDQDVGDPHPIAFEIIEPEIKRPTDIFAFEKDLFELGNVTEDDKGHYRVPVFVKNPVDREAIIDNSKTLYLGIRAIEYDPLDRPDREKGTAEATFTIKINDVNDFTPTFSRDVYYISISEITTTTPESYRRISNQIDILVSDSDSSLYNRFDVAIISGNDLGHFRLDQNSGNRLERFSLFAKEGILDYEIQPNFYVLELDAVDRNDSSRVSYAFVEISINDANDHAPKFLNVTAVFSIEETAPIGTIIGAVPATDEDSGAFGTIVRYEIFGEADTFSIDKDGVIRLEQEVDYELRESYFFTVLAFDGGVENEQREGSINVDVQINNVPDVGPVFIAVYVATLREDSLTLIPDIVVEAQSREAIPDIIEYGIASITPSNIPLSAFSIGTTDGVLSVEQYINFRDTDEERPGIVNVNVSAESGGLFAFRAVTIRIIDINNFRPEFIPVVPDSIYYAEVSELSPPGYQVFAFEVIDNDGADTENGRVTFQVQSGANEDFLITADSGVIQVTENAFLDIQLNQDEYTIVVTARDNGGETKTATATLIVTVIDANNKNPVFDDSLYRFQINADDPIGAEVGGVYATDIDNDSFLVYYLDYNSVIFEKQSSVLQKYIDASEVVRIRPDTSMIEVAGVINRAEYDRIRLNVIAEDININTTIQTRQTATASVVIFILAAVDPTIYFTNDGWDREFETIPVIFSESRSRNYPIVTLTATDPEIPASISLFRIVPGSDDRDYFVVNGSLVVVKRPLDYEALPASKEISVAIHAISDDRQKTATATVVVTVLDLNDNAPIFEQPTGYEFFVPEDKKAPYRVGSAKATDLDTSSYGQVEYQLLGAQLLGDKPDFTIFQRRTGTETEAVIFIAENATLDFETKPFYDLVLIASDNPGSLNTVKFVTDVEVKIIVLDRNDIKPQFEEAVYNISVVGTKLIGKVKGEVFYIRAVDGDAGINGQVDYFIRDATNNGTKFFGIDTRDQASDTFGEVRQVGLIYVKSSLQSLPDRAIFELTVVARDRGSPYLTGTCKVIITVSKGVQDLKPKWDERLPARVRIEEERPIGTPVAQLIAYPADVTGKIIYSFVQAGDALRDYDSFDINPETGEITTRLVIDYEKQRIYNLLVLATDVTNETLTNQYLLIVQILDIDDNQPSFADCPDKVYLVPETTSVDEEQVPGVFVYRAQACDRDDPPHNGVRYSWFIDNDFCAPDNLNVFRLNENTGQVATKIPLDREDRDEYLLCIEASRPNVQNPEKDLESLDKMNKLLFVRVTVNDLNDLGPYFLEPAIKTVILQYPAADISVAEAYDDDLPPNNGIRYSIDNIDFTIGGKTQNAPTAFTINANDGTIAIGTNDYTDYVGGYFDITVRAEDYNGYPVPYDNQLQRVYVTDRANRIRVVFNEPADAGVDQKAKDMIKDLNDRYEDSGMYFEIEKISYHVVSSNADPSFDKTDVCLVVVENDEVLSAVSATDRLTTRENIKNTLRRYGAVDPGSCDPAVSVYPIGWESYWWVLVAFAIFIFVCCLILIVLICILYRQYKQYMDSRKTYLVPGN